MGIAGASVRCYSCSNRYRNSAIIAIIAIGVLLWKNWDVVKEKAKQLGAFLKVVWEGIKNGLSIAWEGIKNVTSKTWNWITGFFKKWGATILVVMSGPIGWIAALIYKNWDAIKSATSKAFNAIKSGISGAWNAIKSITSSVWNGIKSTISGVWNGIKSLVSSAINGVRSKVSSAFNAVKSTTISVWNGIKSGIQNVWNGIVSKISSMISRIKNSVRSGFAAMKSLITSPFEAAKRTVEKILGGLSSKIGKVKNFVGGLFSVETPEIVAPGAPVSGTMGAFGVQGSITEGASAMGSLTDSMSALDFSGSRYRSDSKGSVIASALSSKADTVMVAKAALQNKNLETQNDLLMQMVNMLAAGQNIAVNVDGREVAKATSSYMDTRATEKS